MVYPFDTRIEKKEMEKIDTYCDLKFEIFKVYKGEVNKDLSFQLSLERWAQ